MVLPLTIIVTKNVKRKIIIAWTFAIGGVMFVPVFVVSSF